MNFYCVKPFNVTVFSYPESGKLVPEEQTIVLNQKVKLIEHFFPGGYKVFFVDYECKKVLLWHELFSTWNFNEHFINETDFNRIIKINKILKIKKSS